MRAKRGCAHGLSLPHVSPRLPPQVLILNGNSVGDDGARYLMNALKMNSSLQYLGLQVGTARDICAQEGRGQGVGIMPSATVFRMG